MKKKRLLMLLLACCLCVVPVLAQGGNISMVFKNEALSTALRQLERVADCKISFAYNDVASYKVNGRVKNATLNDALKFLLDGKPLDYSVNGRMVDISRSQETGKSQPATGRRRLKGLVSDEEGNPLVGAHVKVEGSKSGTVVDAEGAYTLPISTGRTTIEVSYLGMRTYSATVQAGTKDVTRNIVLTPSSTTLGEVVITNGYQTIDPRNNTAAITSVKMEDLLMPNMTTIDQSLEGRIPDLVFTTNSGEAGVTGRVRMRGTSTISGKREPLWVLDGFVLQDPVDVSTEQLNDPDYINYIGNAISGINPEDIDRIDVLRDAAATAIYGTRASNGVIVVTTKKGKVGPPTIRYSGQMTVTQRPHYTDSNIKLMNSQERVKFGQDLCNLHYAFPQNMPMVGYEGAFYRYETGQTTYQQFLQEVQRYETVNTDWFDILTKNAVTTQHSVSMSGGQESTRYYASLGYTRQNDVIRTQYVDRYTMSMNLTSTLSKQLKLNLRMNGNVQKKNHLPSDVGVMDYAYQTTRALPCYNSDGSLYYYQRRGYNVGNGQKSSKLYNYNIINEINNTENRYDGNTISVSGDMNYRLGKLFDFTAAANYSRSSTAQSTWYGENTNYVAILKNGEAADKPMEGESGLCELPYGGVYNTSNTTSENLTARLQANFHYSTKDRLHVVNAAAGYEVNVSKVSSVADNTRGYFKERGMKYMSMTGDDLAAFPLYQTWLAEGHRTLTESKTNSLSGYLTSSYTYHDILTFGLTGRVDASNRFGSRSNNKFNPIWTSSAAWNIRRTFWGDPYAMTDDSKNILDDWKVRASFGYTGNMLDGQTPDLLIRLGTLDTYYGQNVSYVSAFPNPDLKWEKTSDLNFGTDVSLFDSRLTLSADFWWRHTMDAITGINVSTINGMPTFQMNSGTLNNHGFSFQLGGYPLKNKDWSLFLSTTYSWASNKVTTSTSDTYNIDDYRNGTAVVNGAAIGTFYSYKFLGLNPNNGLPMFDDYEDHKHLLAGLSLEDVVKNVMVQSGNRTPKFTGNFYGTLTWRQLSLRANVNYSVGSKVRLFKLYSPIISGVSSDKNVRREFTERWRSPGDEKYTNIPALLSPADKLYQDYAQHWSNGLEAKLDNIQAFAASIWDMYDLSDLRVVPGDYLRLSNLSLSYNFKRQQLKKTPLKSLRIDLSVTNVFTIASGKLNGQSPTQAGFASVNLSERPAYTVGVNVSF